MTRIGSTYGFVMRCHRFRTIESSLALFPIKTITLGYIIHKPGRGNAKTEKSGAPRTEHSEYDDFEEETPTSHSASDFEASPTNNAGK